MNSHGRQLGVHPEAGLAMSRQRLECGDAVGAESPLSPGIQPAEGAEACQARPRAKAVLKHRTPNASRLRTT